MLLAGRERGLNKDLGFTDLLKSTSNETWAARARALQAAGVNPGEGNAEAMQKLVRALERNSAATEKGAEIEEERLKRSPHGDGKAALVPPDLKPMGEAPRGGG